MYANILLSADGSEVAKNGVKHGIALAKALNANSHHRNGTAPGRLWERTRSGMDSLAGRV